LSGSLQRVSNDGYGSHFNAGTITLCPRAVNVFVGCHTEDTIVSGMQKQLSRSDSVQKGQPLEVNTMTEQLVIDLSVPSIS
jgi:hypothetical protein